MVAPEWWSDIRRFVARADVEVLKEALDGDLLHSGCPQDALRSRDHIAFASGHRTPVRFFDGWWWSCPDCGEKGTRYLLETEVISDPDAVTRLLARMHIRSVA